MSDLKQDYVPDAGEVVHGRAVPEKSKEPKEEEPAAQQLVRHLHADRKAEQAAKQKAEEEAAKQKAEEGPPARKWFRVQGFEYSVSPVRPADQSWEEELRGAILFDRENEDPLVLFQTRAITNTLMGAMIAGVTVSGRKTIFHKFLLEWHPDKHGNDPDWEFKGVSADVLAFIRRRKDFFLTDVS